MQLRCATHLPDSGFNLEFRKEATNSENYSEPTVEFQSGGLKVRNGFAGYIMLELAQQPTGTVPETFQPAMLFSSA